ncbi:M23 family metallopeptidase [Neorhizobium sp. CSC1952]|uniref:Murein DD-endopeptidase MepM and murein hydrolase activator NlpD, contain LysM domain n=1 Tax=Xaviernesmea oryzae TaxID=464029 RepID=A0A1X7CF58_9HYPH|nr:MULTISPECIES: M23 family metallopeptidase [Rhizobium/Agrobacterium group]WJR69392.1 M23 family metallopeptidase [Rhizobium sp. CSC1952]SME95335.1 Murein DD-endopeptidase MepM and murein hydrolase activator NlpD, contain LysM domain [Xaviernesmea oryzae]
MMTARSMIRSLGNEPPILADGRRAPDRREISLRWLSGTFLTGITSSILMGVALFAALDGRQQLAIPAEASASVPHDDVDIASRGKRLLGGNIVAMPTDRKIMEVSTVLHEGNKEVVRRRPFAHVKMNLAANHVAQEDYPSFDPLTIFSSSETPPPPAARAGAIYGSNVESEVSLQTAAFPLKGSAYAYAPAMTLEEVEENVRSNGSVLASGNTQLSALYYVDPQRFSSKDDDLDITAGLSARVVEENISVSAPEPITSHTREYADDIIPVRKPETVTQAMTEVGYPEGKAQEISGYLQSRLGGADLLAGDVLRIGVIQEGDMVLVVRASVYRRGKHQVTIAVDDHGRFIDGDAPPMLDAVASAFSEQPPQVMTGRELPRVYDGIYRAALSYGMSKEMTSLLVKLLASNVDLQAQLKPTDRVEAFFSVTDEKGQASKDSELLYVNAQFGDTTTRFYRFQNSDDGSIDYFDEDGKSIRQFLLRNPLPNGRMTSGFGMRAHPILGRSVMHTGTDWAAPRGTPIIATGNGVVEKAGWDSGGYGNQTLIRHANGYVSSYNHQSAIAPGVREGAKITQGQVIGYVGSTGQSTGAHLHYELIVNGTKVDPMRVRLPGGSSLEGKALARFEEERKRIDALLNNQPDEVASR